MTIILRESNAFCRSVAPFVRQLFLHLKEATIKSMLDMPVPGRF